MDTNMSKRKKDLVIILKRLLMICLIIALAGEMNSIDVYAATGQNVTVKYKAPVTKLLRRFDSYFGLGCKKSVKVKFDIYAKSTMSYMDYPEYIGGKRLSYVQKKLKKNMKKNMKL